MNNKTRFYFGLVLLALPILVAWFDYSVLAAVLLVLLALLVRQMLVLSSLVKPATGPELVLETIPPSHFAEKGRWCMDRLGVEYEEQISGGVIGAFFTGRSIPMLTARTGRSRSAITESSEILRYLYGRYAVVQGDRAEFLKPTDERLAWEKKLDRYGVDQQIWIYHHLLGDPGLCKEAWGAGSQRIPAWHRWAILVLYPALEMLIKRGFDPSRARYEQAVERSEALLAEVEGLLEDGRTSLLAGEAIDFTDITLASLSSLWLQPELFDSGRGAGERIALDRMPEKYRADRDRWIANYPNTIAHMQRLYEEQRLPSP